MTKGDEPKEVDIDIREVDCLLTLVFEGGRMKTEKGKRRRKTSYLLTHAIKSAWSWGNTRRVWVHTCTLDHDSALPNYQARGMKIYRTENS